MILIPGVALLQQRPFLSSPHIGGSKNTAWSVSVWKWVFPVWLALPKNCTVHCVQVRDVNMLTDQNWPPQWNALLPIWRNNMKTRCSERCLYLNTHFVETLLHGQYTVGNYSHYRLSHTGLFMWMITPLVQSRPWWTSERQPWWVHYDTCVHTSL